MTEISVRAFDALRSLAEAEGHGLQPNYSGRGMFGSQCVAFTTDEGVSSLVNFVLGVAELVSTEDDEVAEELGNVVEHVRESRTRSDSFGHGAVYYWPDLEVTR